MDYHDIPDNEKAELLAKYAPIVWLAEGEYEIHHHGTFYPSSVEYALENCNVVNIEGAKWLVTREPMKSAQTILPYFRGIQPSKENKVPVYAMISNSGGVIRLHYFFFYPYNFGKQVDPLPRLGNHVGDWEYMYVDLNPDNLDPLRLYISQHDGGQSLMWNQGGIEYENTHPVVYSAYGTHATYATEGDHDYKNLVVTQLTDYCHKGFKWNTQDCMVSLEYSGANDENKKVLRNDINPNDLTWPDWMSLDNKNHIWRWGNPERGRKYFDQMELEDAPTGPSYKENIWNNVPNNPGHPNPNARFGPYKLYVSDAVFIINPWGYMQLIPTTGTYTALFGDFHPEARPYQVALGEPIINGILINNGGTIYFCYDVERLPNNKRGKRFGIPSVGVLKQYCFNRGTHFSVKDAAKMGFDFNAYEDCGVWG